MTPLWGPIILVRIASPGSEMPAGVWLGFGSGTALGFVDLWEGAGPGVMSDQTELGPAHALAPHRCGEAFGLLVQPRTNAGVGVDPDPQLVARAGLYGVDGTGAKRTGDAPKGCELLSVPLP